MSQISPEVRRQIESELRPRIEDEFAQIIRKLKDQKTNSENEAELLRLDLQTKDKEISLIESSRRTEQQKYMSDIEDLRKRIHDDLWNEYETRLNNKQEEYDLRVGNATEEVDRLSKALNEWRQKCADAEKRSIELMNDLDQKSCEETNLRKMLNDLESRGCILTGEIEKSHNNVRDKILNEEKLLRRCQVFEAENHEILVKYENLELQNAEISAKNKVLDRELSRTAQKVTLLSSDLNKKVEDLGDKEIKILKLESQLKIRTGESDTIKRELNENLDSLDQIKNMTLNLESGLRLKEGGVLVLEELVDKLKIELTRSEQDCLSERRQLENFRKDNMELLEDRNHLRLRGDDLEKDLLYLASQLADKENYCGLLVEEGEVYKQSLLKMNEEGMKLEREVQDKENLIRTYEKFNDENRYMHGSADDEKDLLRRRYNELKDESEKLVQVNSMIRADLDDFREKYRELES